MPAGRKVLLISYIYPPAGGGGSPRLVRWTRAIANSGRQPVVVTVKEVFARSKDQSLLDEVSGIARIERTESLDPKRIVHLLQSAFGSKGRSELAAPAPAAAKSSGLLWRAIQAFRLWLMVPDDLIGWLPFAALRAAAVIRREKPELIITSSWPHSVQLLGLLLKKIFKLPWIADFRDNWAGHPHYFFPTQAHRKLNAWMEKAVVRNADLVTFAYGLKQAQEAHPRFKAKFRELSNGFRERDFQGVEPMPQTGFNMLFLGALYGAHGPKNFFQALQRLLRDHPELKSELKLRLIGQFFPFDLALAKEYGLEEVVTFMEFIPHNQVFRWMLAADVLVLILSGDVESSQVVPGKVFEYLRSPAWVLGVIPEGETAEILRAAGGAMIASGRDPEKIAEAILKLHRLWKQGQKPERNMDYVMTKEEDYLSRQMSEYLGSGLDLRHKQF